MILCPRDANVIKNQFVKDDIRDTPAPILQNCVTFHMCIFLSVFRALSNPVCCPPDDFSPSPDLAQGADDREVAGTSGGVLGVSSPQAMLTCTADDSRETRKKLSRPALGFLPAKCPRTYGKEQITYICLMTLVFPPCVLLVERNAGKYHSKTTGFEVRYTESIHLFIFPCSEHFAR